MPKAATRLSSAEAVLYISRSSFKKLTGGYGDSPLAGPPRRLSFSRRRINTGENRGHMRPIHVKCWSGSINYSISMLLGRMDCPIQGDLLSDVPIENSQTFVTF